MANVAKSARDAQSIGYLLPTDTIVFNIHELLYVAKSRARALANAGYRPPLAAANIVAAGYFSQSDFAIDDCQYA